MDNALIVSHKEKSAAYLGQVLSEAFITDITIAKSGGEARRLALEGDFDLCIISAPLPDEFGVSLAQNIAQKSAGQVILMVSATLYDEITEKVEDYGIITLAKPINKPLLWNAVKMAQAVHRRVKAAGEQNKKLLQKIEDIKIIDRAKCVLISVNNMTEPEAHRHIEKQAMDNRVTRREIAERILKKYENQ